MRVVKIIGGLGNQMFQYAFYLALKHNIKVDVLLDINSYDNYTLHNGYELGKIFENIDTNYAKERDLKKLLGVPYFLSKYSSIFLKFAKNYIRQNDFGYNEEYLKLESAYFDGYWQTEKYFNNIRDEVLHAFIFPPLGGENLKIIEKYKGKKLASIHIRRGDYVNHPLHGGICDLSYYQKAIELLKNSHGEIQLLVFSNDIEWCKQSLDLANAEYVDWNNGVDSYKDMQLMSLCSYNIIANSSFSWWGAWLNRHKDKVVIAPSKWFNNDKTHQNDIYLKSWIRI